jgi:AraC-like DNA-binding protein
LSDLYELILLNAAHKFPESEEICINLLRVLLLKAGQKNNIQLATGTRAWDTYERVLLHLRKNYLRIKTMEQLAEETHLNPAYLSRVFRRFHKDSPYTYLVRMKMEHAASLLLKSGSLVKEIAYELGFENPYHFSRSFKKFHGVSPEGFIGRCKR